MFKIYKTKNRDRVRVDTEYYSGGRKVTVHIRLWLAVLILLAFILGVLVLIT